MIKRIYSIKDMHCASCVMRVEGIEDKLPGIKQISASYQKQIMTVMYDEDVVSEDQIITAVSNLGYHIEMV